MVALLLIWMTSAGLEPTQASDKTPSERASALVRQLGHARFATRESAAKALIEMGDSAVAALQEASRSPDPEIRDRAAAVLSRIKDLHWARRAAAYLADRDGKQKHDLPLLTEWEKLVGKSDDGTKRLFAEMVQTNGAFLKLAATDSNAARVEISKRSKDMGSRAWILLPGRAVPVDLSPTDVAALLFVQSVTENGRDSETHLDESPANFLCNPAVVAAIRSKEEGRAYRLLLNGWGQSRPLRDDALTRLPELSILIPLPEALPQLIRMAKDSQGGTSGGNAIAGIARIGSPQSIEAFEGMLTDKKLMFAKPAIVKPELRDCALAALIKLRGKEPTDFGLIEAVKWTGNYGPLEERITVRLYGFASETARLEGLKKWQNDIKKK